MICPNCNTSNDDHFIYCVNCGSSIAGSGEKTESFPSVATVLSPHTTSTTAPPTIHSIPFHEPGHAVDGRRRIGAEPGGGRANSSAAMKVLGIGAALLLVIGGTVAGALYYLNRPLAPPAVLPEHLGVFAIDPEKRTISELTKREFANVKDGRDAIAKESISPVLRAVNEFVVYADPADVKIDDLKFLRLDSITDKGSMRQIDFQASLIEGKPAMKRLRFPTALPSGKYAFAIFNGSFDEGKHKFWAFEIDGFETAVVPPGREFSVALKDKKETTEKPVETPQTSVPQKIDKPSIDIPVGARIAYCNASDVVVRSSPGLMARKTNSLRRGQRVYLLSYSDNFDYWNGIRSNWALIQTENGKRGWVFTPFISY